MITSEALRYVTRSQGISQFYLHTQRSSAIGMSHICLCLPSYSWYSFTDPRGIEGWVGRDGWLRIVRQFTFPKAVTHPTTYRAQCSEQLRWSRPTHYRYTKQSSAVQCCSQTVGHRTDRPETKKSVLVLVLHAVVLVLILQVLPSVVLWTVLGKLLFKSNTLQLLITSPKK